MYSPKIYESQIPCLYHASQSMAVPMTQLANAFVYHGLISGYYGSLASAALPNPNQVLPPSVNPKMQIFHPNYDSIRDYMMALPPIETINGNFQTLADLVTREVKLNTPIPFRKEEGNEAVRI